VGKGILGVVAGLAVWMIVVSVAGLVLRAAWPEYVSAAGTMTFTASMKVVGGDGRRCHETYLDDHRRKRCAE
jgi:glycerol-3-phosphate acyltransferase PlsY